MADERVRDVQNWLNNTYGSNANWVQVDADGQTGFYTVKALVRALQIELGLEVDGTFGNGTKNGFDTRFPNGLSKSTDATEQSTKNIIAIVNGGFWCRGIEGERNDRYVFGDYTEAGVILMKSQLGILQPTGEIKAREMKAILTTDAYTLTSNGDASIREIQQQINRKYIDIFGSYIATSGIYERNLNTAIIKAIQHEIGVEVDGGWGEGTKSALPALGPGSSRTNLVYILQYLLYLNGFDPNGFDGGFGNGVTTALKAFQTLMKLDVDGYCGRQAWSALVVSCGDTARSANACDTRFEMTEENLTYLKNNGYEVVGRYLTGGNFKELRIGEVQRILNKGIKLFPIFQESGTDLSYFTAERGKEDAKNAVLAARKHGIPGDNIIYFAVDTDPVDSEIEKYIIPYFKSIAENISKAYKVGIYGTRNVCTQVINNGYAETCFLSDMSYGYSGNMGFKIPENWNLDQFYEISDIDTGSSTMDLDKVTYSGRYPVVENIYASIITFNFYLTNLENLYRQYKINKSGSCSTRDIILGVTNFLRSFKYGEVQWYVASLNAIDTEFIDYVRNQDSTLYNNIVEYASTDAKALTDGIGGLIDIGHLAATIEGYFDSVLAPDFWFGWGGDLATLMSEVDEKYNSDGPSHIELAKSLIGDRSNFNYSDICTDADAIKIAQILQTVTNSNNPFSEVISSYYINNVELRYSYYLLDLDNSNLDLSNLKSVIFSKVTGVFENVVLLPFLGTLPTSASKDACCEAFAQYIIDNYPVI